MFPSVSSVRRGHLGSVWPYTPVSLSTVKALLATWLHIANALINFTNQPTVDSPIKQKAGQASLDSLTKRSHSPVQPVLQKQTCVLRLSTNTVQQN